MNQDRRSFIKIISLASASFLPVSSVMAQALGEDEESKRRADRSFNEDYQFHLIDNNLLNLHFYFVNTERKRNKLKQRIPGKKSFMIVRLTQMHVSEKGFWDDDWTHPTRKFPAAKLSGYSYLAFQLWPEYKNQTKKLKKRELEFTLENILNWNDQFNFELITLTEWFELKNEDRAENEKKWDLIFRNYEQVSPTYDAALNVDFGIHKLWYKDKAQVEAEFNDRNKYYIKVDHEPRNSFNYKKYTSIVLNFLDKNYNSKNSGNDFIPITFLEAPANLCLVPLVRNQHGELARAEDNVQKKFWTNKMVERYNTIDGRNKYEVWLNTLFFATKIPNTDSREKSEQFSYQTPSFRVVGLIAKDLPKAITATGIDCKEETANFLPSLLNKTELTFLTQYAKQEGERDYTHEDFDIKEINGLFFTGLGIITHYKYYNADQCPVDKGIDLIEYEHRITQGRDLFIKVARLGYNSKTGQRYKHVIEAKKKIDLVDYKPTAFLELKQYCECIDKHIIYNEAEVMAPAWQNKFKPVTTTHDNLVINPAKGNYCDVKRNIFQSLTVIENKRIPIRCLTAIPLANTSICDLEKIMWFWPVLESATAVGDHPKDIPYSDYLMCEYQAKDWENVTINAATPFVFLRAIYIESNDFNEVNHDYFLGNYKNPADRNFIERRKTYFGNQKIAYTPTPNQKLTEYLNTYSNELKKLKIGDSRFKLTAAIVAEIKTDLEDIESTKSKTNILETDFIESYFHVKTKAAFGNEMTATKYIVFPQLLRANVFIDHIRDLTQQKISSVVEYQKDYIDHEFKRVKETDGKYANGARVILRNTEAFIAKQEEAVSNTYETIGKALQESKSKLGNLAVPDIIPDSISLEKFGITLPKDIKKSIDEGRTVLESTKGIEKIASFNPIELLRGKLSDVCGLDLTKVLDELLPATGLDNQTPLFEINKLLNQVQGVVLNSPIYKELINVQVQDPLDPTGPKMTIPALINKYEKAINDFKQEIENKRLLLNQSVKQLSEHIPNADELDNLVKTLTERYRTQAFEFISSISTLQDIVTQLNNLKANVINFFETEKQLLHDELEQRNKVLNTFFNEVEAELKVLPASLKQLGAKTVDEYIKDTLKGFYIATDLNNFTSKINKLFDTVSEDVKLLSGGKEIFIKIEKSDKITWELTFTGGPSTKQLFVFDISKANYVQFEKKLADLKAIITKNINGNLEQKAAVEIISDFLKNSKVRFETLEKEVQQFQTDLGSFIKQLDLWKIQAQQYLQQTVAIPPATQDAIVKVMAIVSKANEYIDFVRKFDPYFYFEEQQRLLKEVTDLEGRFKKDWVAISNKLDIKGQVKKAVEDYRQQEVLYADAIKNLLAPVPVITQEQLNMARNLYIDYRKTFIDGINSKSAKIIDELIKSAGYAQLKTLHDDANKYKGQFENAEKSLKKYADHYKNILSQQANDLKKGFDDKLKEFIDELEAELRDTVGSTNIQTIENTIAEAKNIYRLITSIKQQELTYNWKTTSFKDVNLGIVAFKKFSNPSTSLNVNVKAVTYFSQGKFPPTIEKIVTYSENSFKNFGISFFNSLVINFNEISFSAGSDRQTHFDVKIKDVKFEGALSFVQAFQSYLQTIGKGFIMSLNADHVALGYSLPIPTIKTPGFSFFNLSLNFDLRVFFDNRPLLFAFSLAKPESKFGIAAGIYAGFGFFSIAADPQRGVVEIDCALEAGVWAGIKIGPIKGEVKLAFGFRYTKNTFGVRLEGYIVAEGRLSVWIIDVSARIYLGVTSVNSYVEGRCTVTYSARLGLVSKSFSGTFMKHIAGAKKENSESQQQAITKYFQDLDKYHSFGVFKVEGRMDTFDIERTKSNAKAFQTYLTKLEEEEEVESYHVSAKEWNDFINAY